MSVWRPSPIPAQLSAGIAALIPAGAAAFVPQAYPAQLMAVAGLRASAFPTQQRGYQAQLFPQPAVPAVPLSPNVPPMAVAYWRPAYALPVALPFNPALFPATAPSAPLPDNGVSQRAAALARGVALPAQAPAFNAALFPSAPLTNPPFDGAIQAQRMIVAGYRPTAMPIQPNPLEPELLDWYEADGAVGQGNTQEMVHAGYRPATLPTQGKPLSPALISAAQPSSPPLPGPYPYVSLWRAPGAVPAAGPGYGPAFDGPYQAPPLSAARGFLDSTRQHLPVQKTQGYNPAFDGPYQQPIPASPLPLHARAQALPVQAPIFNPAIFAVVPPNAPPLMLMPSPLTRAAAFHSQASVLNPALLAVQIDAPPIQSPFTSPALERPVPLRAQAPSLNPALFIGPQVDAPPLASIAGMPAPPVRLQILPAQRIPFNVALLPAQVDAPPLMQPYPYIAIARVIALTAQARPTFPLGAVIPDAPPLTGFGPLLPSRPAATPTQSAPGYNPAFDGPYQVPPIAAFAQAITQAVAMPVQARFDIAPFIGPPIPPPPLPLPIQLAIYARAAGIPVQASPLSPSLYLIPGAPPIAVLAQPLFSIGSPLPQQVRPFQPALFLVPDAPPLTAIPSMPPPLFKPWILPVQGRPFNPAFLPPQVDTPPLVMPFPYVALLRPPPWVRQAPMAYPLFVAVPIHQPSQLYAGEDFFLIELRAKDYFF